MGRARGQQRRATNSDRARRGRRCAAVPKTAPTPCCWRRGSRRRRATSNRPAATSPRPPSWPTAIHDVDLQRAMPVLPGLCRVASRRVRPRDGADRPQSRASTTGWTGPGIRPRTGCSPPEPRSRPVTRNAASRLAEHVAALGGERSTTRGCTVRRDAMLGELARIQHRFDDAVVHIGRAAETSRRLGFQQTEAYQVASLGRALCQAGDYDAGAATLELAIDKAEATGDVRLAALARVHLGRVLRGARTARAERARLWKRPARGTAPSGGGEQAALGECLLAAMDAADRGRRRRGASRRRSSTMPPASRATPHGRGLRPRRPRPDRCVRRATIEPLTASVQSADRAGWLSVSHFITELDRADARSGQGAFLSEPPRGACRVRLAALVQHQESQQTARWRWRCRRSAAAQVARPAAGMTTRQRGRAGRPGKSRWSRSGSVFCANTISPWAATPVRNVRTSM